MKILVGCRLAEEALPELRTLGTDVVYEPDISIAHLEEAISDAAVLVVCRNRVSPEVIEAGSELQLIVRAGADTSNIALDEAADAGIFVANTPNQDAVSIAELAFGYLIVLDRDICGHASRTDFRQGSQKWPIESFGLSGRTLGVLGYGYVEKEVIKRAKAFDMLVSAWGTALTPETAARIEVDFCAWPREIARRSDMIIVHAPPSDRDELVVDADFLDNMRPEARLVFVGRPGGIDLQALIRVIREKQIRFAYDISSPQLTPGAAGRFISKLKDVPNVVGSSRLGDFTRQTQSAVSQDVVRVIREFLVNGNVVNCVNLMERSPAKWQLVLRIKDRVGVMASVMNTIGIDGVNAEDITCHLFKGGKAAWCIIAVDERPSTETLSTIRELDGVLNLEIRALV